MADYLTKAFEQTDGANMRLLSQLRFLFELEKLKAELRQTLTYVDKDQTIFRQENVGEHSWHITVFALLLQEYAAEPVDIKRTVEMMLFHDVIEIYAGDVDVFSTEDKGAIQTREKAAAEELFAFLPADQQHHYKALWEEFDEGKTPEARYARAIDRVHPILANFLSGGAGWHKRGITYEKSIATHEKRVTAGSPELWNAIKIALDYGRDNGFFPPEVK